MAILDFGGLVGYELKKEYHLRAIIRGGTLKKKYGVYFLFTAQRHKQSENHFGLI